jgi:hypothetical protein
MPVAFAELQTWHDDNRLVRPREIVAKCKAQVTIEHTVDASMPTRCLSMLDHDDDVVIAARSRSSALSLKDEASCRGGVRDGRSASRRDARHACANESRATLISPHASGVM